LSDIERANRNTLEKEEKKKVSYRLYKSKVYIEERKANAERRGKVYIGERKANDHINEKKSIKR
jgi:hypothetical protein